MDPDRGNLAERFLEYNMVLIQIQLPKKCVKLNQCQKDKVLQSPDTVTFSAAFSNMD